MTELTEAQFGSIEDLLLQLRQRERELAAVVSITRALQARLGLHELMHQAVLAAMSTVNADAGSLLLHDSERQKLVFRHVEGPTRDKVMGLEIDDTRGIAGEVFHSSIARISHDVSTERSHILDIEQAVSYHTQNMITVPLRAGTGENIGVMQILNKHTGLFDESDLAVVEVLATQVASAIVTAQLYERAQAAVIVDLLGQISHDIKNLLTPVSMAEQTLRIILTDFQEQVLALLASPEPDIKHLVPAVSGKVHQINDEVEEIFEIFEESTQIAQQRTKELSDTVKGLTTPPVYELNHIDEVIQGVCRVLRVMAEQREITLCMQLGETPAVYYDAKRMYNALYNLVYNAIDATPPGGIIGIVSSASLDGAFPDGCYVQVAVTDTGCGMPPDVAKRLFTGHVQSTKPGGTGLGTRVVKNVIEAHKGKLYVESIEGKGTTIAARLPIRTDL